jgi:hypothetical protein
MAASAAQPGRLRHPAALLAAWEAVAGVPTHERGPALLRQAGLSGPGDPLDVPLATLAPSLAHCYGETFGARAEGTVSCPGCGTALDVEVELAWLDGAAPERPVATEAPVGPGRLTVRAPTARDLLAAAGAADAAGEIVARCVRGADGRPARLAHLTPDDRSAVDAELERLTGAGLPQLRTACPDCGAAVVAAVDAGALLAAAVTAAAARLLRDVAELAGAYGWSESEVLALSALRRAAYLELARR